MDTQSRDDDVLDDEEEEARVDELPEISDDSDESYEWNNIIKQITADPSLAKVDKEGVLPLHAACGANAPVHVIKMLLEAYPEAAQAKTDNGYLPLFCHLVLNTESPSEDIVSVLLESFPGAAAVADNNNQLPIHLACMAKGVSKNIFTMILRAYPKGAYACDIEGFYPVDYAAGNKDVATRKAALASLIANDPEEIRGHYIEQDESAKVLLVNGPTPETRSDLVNLTDDIIQDILTSFTLTEEAHEAALCLMRATSTELLSVCRVVDEKSLLLHLEQCIEHGSSPSQAIVTTLIESYPTSARVVNSRKQLPIHLACMATGVSDNIFTMILRAYPQGAYTCDVNGMCPIDYAVSNKDVTSRNTAVAALVQNDSQENLHEASTPTIAADTSLQHNIFEGDEPATWSVCACGVMDITTDDDEVQANSLREILACDSSPPEAIVLSAIESHPGAIRVIDADGQLPIHHACQAKYVSENTFAYILGAYPEGAYVPDNFGNYPIDYAIRNQNLETRLNAIAALLQNDAAKGLAPKRA